MEKILEWGVAIIVVILGARWLAGLFNTGDPVQGTPPQMGYPYQPYGGYLSNGVIIMQPGIMGPGARQYYGRGRGRRR